MKRERAFKLSKYLSEIIYTYPRVRKVTSENLSFTGFPKHYGKLCVENFLKCLVDFVKSRDYSNKALKDMFEISGTENIPKNGCIFLTAHMGNWELLGGFFSRITGKELYVVAKPMKNRFVDNFINDIRKGLGLNVIKLGNTKKLLSVLKGENYLGMLLDQRPRVREAVATKFLGRRTYTNRGLAILSLRFNKPVVPAFCYLDGLTYKATVEKPIYPDGKTVEELTRIYAERISDAVSKHPEHWFWFHRRWKNSEEFKSWQKNH